MTFEFNEKKFEELISRKEELKKKQLLAFSMGLGNHIHEQFRRILDEIDIEIYSMNEIKKENAKKPNENDEGLII
jgi:predicted nucleotide-binding protein (sugar kinase/HSP70/actin superfamily)